MRQSSPLSLGFDVHTDARAGAYGATEHDAEVIDSGRLGTRQADSAQLARTLPGKAQRLLFVYAARPCGSWRSRSLTQKSQLCWVVAHSQKGGRPRANQPS
jgi:hypothetical protein